MDPSPETTRASVVRRTAVATLHFLLCMTAYYVMKPVREAVFMNSEGYLGLPKVHIMVAFSSYFAALGYDWLARAVRPGALAANATLAFIGGLLTMCLALHQVPPGSWGYRPIPWLYYNGVSLFVLFMVALFWSLTHNAFRPEEGKRYYGIIGSGGILGGWLGSILTSWSVGRVGTDNLLLLAAVILAPSLWTGRWLDRQRLERKDDEPKEKPRAAWSLLLSDRYLAGIGMLVMMTMLLEELGDHQTNRVLTLSGFTKDEYTYFYARLNTWINMTGVLLNWGLVAFVQVRYGPLPGLATLQLAAVAKNALVYLYPTPENILWGLFPEMALHYSLYNSAKELLYTPTDPQVKYRVKTLVETFLFRAGICLGAILVLFYFQYQDMSHLLVASVIVAVANIVLGQRLSAQYRQKLAAQ